VALVSGRPPSLEALTSWAPRLSWLCACCAVAEGADVPLSLTEPYAGASSSRSPPALCVSAVLGDALHRASALGGREGMPRSLGSVYGGSVTRFLGGAFQRAVRSLFRVHGAGDAPSSCNGIVVSVDGCTLLVSDISSHALREFSAADGSRRRVVGSKGEGPLQFNEPRQLCIAPDGFVFVAEYGNNRVQVLTPTLGFHCFIGQGQLERPAGVCADADVVVVSERLRHCISVFCRRDGALHRQFGSLGGGRGQLKLPCGLCFLSGPRHVAVADHSNHRVSVFSVDGEFIRHVSAGVLSGPEGVAASAFDELVVADTDYRRLRLFSDTGDLLARLGDGRFKSVAIRGSSVFAVDIGTSKVAVFQ
jgi:hypothetical protein